MSRQVKTAGPASLLIIDGRLRGPMILWQQVLDKHFP